MPIVNDLLQEHRAVVDLRVWRQFVAVAEELHFGRAADRLHMTQPPLTQSIAQLERTLGVLLFDRSRRHVALTAAGEALLPGARSLLLQAYHLPDFARAAAAGDVGRLRLAFACSVSFGQLPTWVRRFRSERPQVSLDLVEAAPDVQMDAFRRDNIDAGLMLHAPGCAPPGFDRLLLGREQLMLAIEDRHPVLTGGVTLSQALELPLIIFPRHAEPSLHDAIFELYRQAGIRPQVVQEAIQMPTIINLVSSGLGVAWVPEGMRRLELSGVTYRSAAQLLEVEDGAPACLPGCDISLIWDPANTNPALRRFIDLIAGDAPVDMARTRAA